MWTNYQLIFSPLVHFLTEFSAKFRFLTAIFWFFSEIRILPKILNVNRNFGLSPKFWFFMAITEIFVFFIQFLNFPRNCCFSGKFWFFTEMLMFQKSLKFHRIFDFLPKFLFHQNFHFSHLELLPYIFCRNFIILSKI